MRRRNLFEVSDMDDPNADDRQGDDTPPPNDHGKHLGLAFAAIVADDALDPAEKKRKLLKLVNAACGSDDDTDMAESRRFRRGRGRSVTEGLSAKDFSRLLRRAGGGR